MTVTYKLWDKKDIHSIQIVLLCGLIRPSSVVDKKAKKLALHDMPQLIISEIKAYTHYFISSCSDAASAVGALTSCEAAQLEAYYAHATTAFGALSGWGTDVISTVGTVVGEYLHHVTLLTCLMPTADQPTTMNVSSAGVRAPAGVRGLMPSADQPTAMNVSSAGVRGSLHSLAVFQMTPAHQPARRN